MNIFESGRWKWILIPVVALIVLIVLLNGCSTSSSSNNKGLAVTTTTKRSTSGSATTNATPSIATDTSVPSITSGTYQTAVSPFQQFGETTIKIVTSKGTSISMRVLVASSEEQRGYGLMNVSSIAPYDGMIFVFPEEVTTSFYMKDTLIPLTVGFFTGGGIFQSSQNMTPCAPKAACILYGATGAYRYAIEVPQGNGEQFGLDSGSRLILGSS